MVLVQAKGITRACDSCCIFLMASRVNVVVDWEAGDTGVSCWTIFEDQDPKRSTAGIRQRLSNVSRDA